MRFDSSYVHFAPRIPKYSPRNVVTRETQYHYRSSGTFKAQLWASSLIILSTSSSPNTYLLNARCYSTRAPYYTAPSPTNEPLEYAELALVDLSEFNTPEGGAQLVEQVTHAISTQGFFYVINHGYTPEQNNEIFSIANLTFNSVSEQEKSIYTSETSLWYDGYKPQKTWLINGKVHDKVEHYNVTCSQQEPQYPEAVRPFRKTIDAFANHNQFNIVHPLLNLLATGLGLPEDTFVRQHDLARGHTSVRFMLYHPRTSEDDEQTNNVWLKGHTDYGSLTILWSQPVGGLQILSPDGKWRWVRHIENALVVNAGDALEFLSGGLYLATRHRVVKPPADQRDVPRLGVFFFAQPDDDVKLVPYEESPILQQVGITRRCQSEQAPTMDVWRKGRMGSYGKVELKKGAEAGVEEEIINGVIVKHYN